MHPQPQGSTLGILAGLPPWPSMPTRTKILTCWGCCSNKHTVHNAGSLPRLSATQPCSRWPTHTPGFLVAAAIIGQPCRGFTRNQASALILQVSTDGLVFNRLALANADMCQPPNMNEWQSPYIHYREYGILAPLRSAQGHYLYTCRQTWGKISAAHACVEEHAAAMCVSVWLVKCDNCQPPCQKHV